MSERDVSLASAERIGDGLPIAVRLRVGIELLRSVLADPSSASAPRAASSRLFFDRVALRPDGEVCATGPGDTSGAALVLWEIFAGRPLEAEPPVRLHDIVDDMPADVDDLMTSALRAGAPPTTAAALFDDLSTAAEPYAVPREDLWDFIPGAAAAAPTTRRQGARLVSVQESAPASVRERAPASLRERAPVSVKPSGPRSTRAPAAAPLPPPSLPPLSRRAGAAASSRLVRAPVLAAAPADLDGPQPPTVRGFPPRAPSPVLAQTSPAVDPRGSGDRISASLWDPSLPSPALLLIHAGEEGRTVATALRRKGYAVAVYRDGAAGMAYAIAENPTCILCDSDLPDTDGESVVRRLRREPSPVADVPFVLIASRADTRRRIARFGAGADICVLKPVKIPALIQQVDALVDMSSRLRAAHQALPALPGITDGAAVTGDIRLVGIGAMLTILEMERRTGTFVATGEGTPVGRGTLSDIDPRDRLELELARGCVSGASAMGLPARPLEVLRSMMRLEGGRFAFKPTKARYCDGPTLSELLTDAARLEDEAAAGR